MTTLVLQNVCDRVIYFTADEAYIPPPSDYTWTVTYSKPLPLGFTLSNCWSWKLKDDTLVEASGVPVKEQGQTKEQVLFRNNKATLAKQLNDKLNSQVETYSPTAGLAHAVHNIILSELQAANESQLARKIALQAGLEYDNFIMEFKAERELLTTQLVKAYAKKLELEAKLAAAATAAELETIRRAVNSLAL